MYSKQFSFLICISILNMSVHTKINENEEDNLNFFSSDNAMVEGLEKDFKPFYEDLKIKPRYLQGAYEHEIKISNL